MKNRQLNAFQVENSRDFFAKEHNKNNFKKLYSTKYPYISNKNSGSMWDDLNFSRSGELTNSPIYVDKISQVLKLVKGKKGNLLDVGFGNGIIERNLKTDFELFGIDISKKSVSALSRLVKGNFKRGNLLKIPFKSSYFDCVLCLDVLEHISPYNIFKALSEIKRVLKPRSTLIISIPLNEGLEQMVKKGINPNAHVRLYTPNIINMELEISGFIVEKELFLTAFNTSYSVKKILNTLFRIRKPNLLIIVAKKI